jgi:uncharacterized protein
MVSQKKTMVIGASLKPWRYAHKAVAALEQHGHPVIAIGLREGKIGNVPVLTGPPEGEIIDTVTLYVGAGRQEGFYEYLMRIHPRRVIFNPGTENDELAGKLTGMGIDVIEACTLVMLATGQY